MGGRSALAYARERKEQLTPAWCGAGVEARERMGGAQPPLANSNLPMLSLPHRESHRPLLEAVALVEERRRVQRRRVQRRLERLAEVGEGGCAGGGGEECECNQ